MTSERLIRKALNTIDNKLLTGQLDDDQWFDEAQSLQRHIQLWRSFERQKSVQLPGRALRRRLRKLWHPARYEIARD